MPKSSADYVTKIQTVKANYLDGLWNSSTGQYEDNNGYGLKGYTWLNVFMVQITAILASRGQSSVSDISRANTIISKLIVSPCYLSSNTWSHLMDGTSDTHEAVDQPVAESLYYAWKYRSQLGLSAGVISSIVNILTVNHTTIKYAGNTLQVSGDSNNQDLGKWLLNRMTYGYLMGANVGSELSSCMKSFCYHIDQPFGPSNNGSNSLSGLFPDFGWRYIEGFNMFHSLEYGSMSLGGSLLFYSDISSVVGLTVGEQARMKAWQRHIFGLWQRNGYPNWDTVWSDNRIHSLSYWLWSIRALLGMIRSPELCQNANDSKYAKFILDQSLDTFTHMDRWNGDVSDGAVSNVPLGVTFPGSTFGIDYNNVKGSGTAKYCMELAISVDLGIADAPSLDPGNMWGWNWTSQDVHVSTPAYSAASVPYAPSVNYWGSNSVQGPGDGVSRIQLPTNEVLTCIGGYGLEAHSFKISSNGSVQVDTGDINAGRPASQQIWIDGVLQSHSAYDTAAIPSTFSDSLRSLVKRSGSAYQSEVETFFYQTKITATHKSIRTGSAGTGQVVISFPCQSDVVMDYISTTNVKTVVWDGSTLRSAGSPDPSACKYIHLKWANLDISGTRAGLILIPISGVVLSGAKVTALGYDPNSYPTRQASQDRSLLLYLADNATSMSDVSLTYDIKITDGTDNGALSVYNEVLNQLPTATVEFGDLANIVKDMGTAFTSGSSTVNGDLSTKVALSASALGSSQVTGAWLLRTIRFKDAITAMVTADGAELHYSTEDFYFDNSTASGSSFVIASLTTKVNLEGCLSASAISTGDLTVHRALVGDILATSHASADTMQTQIGLHSDCVVNASSLSGDLLTYRRPTIKFSGAVTQRQDGFEVYYSTEDMFFQGDIQAQALPAADLKTRIAFTGAVVCSVDVQGRIDIHPVLVGDVRASSNTADAQLITHIQAYGNALGSSQVTADLTTYRRPTLKFSKTPYMVFENGGIGYDTEDMYFVSATESHNSAVVTAALNTKIALAGASTGTVAVAGDVFAHIPLQGSVNASASVSGAPLTHIQLKGNSVSSSAATGDLKTYRCPTIKFTATPNVIHNTSGDQIFYSTEDMFFSGAIVATSSISAPLTSRIALQGNVIAPTTIQGDLNSKIVLSGNISGAATPNASLKSTVSLSGDLFGTSSVQQAALDRQIRFAGNVRASSFAQATGISPRIAPTIKFSDNVKTVIVGEVYTLSYNTEDFFMNGAMTGRATVSANLYLSVFRGIVAVPKSIVTGALTTKIKLGAASKGAAHAHASLVPELHYGTMILKTLLGDIRVSVNYPATDAASFRIPYAGNYLGIKTRPVTDDREGAIRLKTAGGTYSVVY